MRGDASEPINMNPHSGKTSECIPVFFRPASVIRDPPDSRSSLGLGQMIGGKVESMARVQREPILSSTEVPVKIGRNMKWISGVNERTKCGVGFIIKKNDFISLLSAAGHHPERAQLLGPECRGAGSGGGVAALRADGGVAGGVSDDPARHAHSAHMEVLGRGEAQCLLCCQENPES